MAVFGKYQEGFPFMAAMGNMPDLPGNEMPICSRHNSVVHNHIFEGEKSLLVRVEFIYQLFDELTICY